MKRENISSLQADLEYLRSNALYARFAESALDSANLLLLFLFDSFAKGLHPSPRSPQLHLNEFPKSCRFFAFRGRASLYPLLAKNRRLHFCNLKSDFLHHEAGEIKGASHGFNVDSANFVNSQNLGGKSNNKSLLKFLLLLAFAKSRVPLNFTDSNLPNKADSQNLAINFKRT